MGLRLESKTQICGEPARLARDVIRRFPHAGPNYPDFPGQTIAVALHLVSDSDRLLRLVEGLTVDGYLERMVIQEEPFFKWTDKGESLAHSRVGLLRRETAARMVEDLVERARAVDGDARCPYKVECIVLFGSYVSTTDERIGDLDVGVSLLPKARGEKFRRMLEEAPRVDDLIRFGQERRYVERKLRGGQSKLSLHEMDKGEVVAVVRGPWRCVYGSFDPGTFKQRPWLPEEL